MSEHEVRERYQWYNLADAALESYYSDPQNLKLARYAFLCLGSGHPCFNQGIWGWIVYLLTGICSCDLNCMNGHAIIYDITADQTLGLLSNRSLMCRRRPPCGLREALVVRRRNSNVCLWKSRTGEMIVPVSLDQPKGSRWNRCNITWVVLLG